jgi:hypothetical protein
VIYLSNHWSDLSKILYYGLCDQNIQQKTDFYKWKRPLIEDNLDRDLIFDDWQRENSKEILEEISSVALRSPACFLNLSFRRRKSASLGNTVSAFVL